MSWLVWKASAFKSLREQALCLPVVPKTFDETATTAPEDEQMTAIRIALEGLLNQQG
jgi:hypothetical protein